MFTIKSCLGTEYKVKIMRSNYCNNGNLAIMLICDDGEPFGNLTVNFSENLPPNMAYVDTNNIDDAERFINEYNLGEFTGKTRESGFCIYPLYKFKEEMLC